MALTRITKGVIKPNENYDTHNIVSTGIVTSVGLDVNGNADVSGSLSVGGVLTYEDVTSIDSVGIITARSGLVSPYADIDDFVSVGSNIHLGNAGVVTATSFVGDGSGLIGVASTDNIVTGTAATFNTYPVDINAGMTVAGVTTFSDDVVVNFGTGNDLQIYHTSSTNRSYIKEVGSGGFYLQAANLNVMNPAGNETMLRAIPDGAVELYHNNIKHFETTSIGCKIYDDDTTAALQFQNSAGLAGLIMGESTNIIGFKDTNPHWLIKCIKDGAVELYHDNSKKLETSSTGITVTGTVVSTGADINGDIDVDGHTNLDNVSIAGVTTFASNVSVGSSIAVGTGVTIESNGQATYAGIITATNFVKADGTSLGASELNELSDAKTSSHNVFVGASAGYSLGSANYNTGVGKQSLYTINNGDRNTALGWNALGRVASSTNNVAVGDDAGFLYTGANLTAIGSQAFKSGTGANNTVIGHRAFMGSSTGTNNVIVGKDAAISMTSGDENVYTGYQSGYSASTSDQNTALGYQSLYTNTLSSYNVALGHKALYTLNRSDAGGSNTAVGWAAGRDMTDGRYNACYGTASGRALTSGEQNTIIGAFASAGSSALTGSLNTFIGYGAGKDSTTSGSNNTIIGCDAEASSSSVSNEVTIGDGNITKFRIPGINVTLKDNGGTPTQGHVLTVDGSGEAGFAAVSADLVNDTSPQLGGDLASNGSDIKFANNDKAIFGTGNDAAIYHNDTDFVIDAQDSGSATRNMYLNAGTVNEGGIFLRSAAGDTMLKGLTDDGVYLYFDNALKFRTVSSGSEFRGDVHFDNHTNTGKDIKFDESADALIFNDSVYARFGTDGDASLWHDGSHLRFNNGTGNFNIQTNDFQITDSSNTTLRFRVDADGPTYIRYNGSDKLVTSNTGVTVTGNVTASGYVDSSSDIKLKTNIKTIDNALDKVLQLRGAEYDRIDRDNQHEIGVIAQEVEKIIPEVVHGDETKTVSYGNMVAVLIEAIKEQNEVINEMKKEIDELKSS